jgi:hypothetical protein
MYVFRRIGDGAAETWEILLPAGSAPKLDRRFGKSLGSGNPDRQRMHEVGVLFAIKRCGEVEILLAAKSGLSDLERRILDGEIEELLGKSVYQVGREDREGWFRWDTLRAE